MKANKSTTINKSVISYLEDQNLVNDSLLVLINNLILKIDYMDLTFGETLVLLSKMHF